MRGPAFGGVQPTKAEARPTKDFDITLLATPPALRPTHLSWRQSSDDVHAATIDGEFAGYVAATDTGFALSDALARPVGTFSTLSRAQDALIPIASARSVAPDFPPGALFDESRRE
jgi:hypothetical protein